MKILELYLETSVWNFYFADDAPEKKAITKQFFDNLAGYDIFISNIVSKEIARAPDEKRELLVNLIDVYEPHELEVTDEALSLAKKYIEEGALPTKAFYDAVHAAVATIYELDALISWNLKHLASLRRMEKINGVNLKEGYSKKLELITPMEVSDEI
ncbi:PIN domain-containing protein [Candidatus Parabeggiatoa sp. HSG14]|uniref:PIN domain-containing protein n=1 Tax=Candidatus Parabeggiatoa sp. HSG14 TaxID=3055593 RepID=UPI0025A7286B|nr:PIN domain-containing protein [Thiotrichales bacterium HSG14]